MELHSSGGQIEQENLLALKLGPLDVASYLDAMMLFGIRRSSCYPVFHETVNSILGSLKLPGLSFHDLSKLQAMYREFTESRIPALELWTVLLSRSLSGVTASSREITIVRKRFTVRPSRPLLKEGTDFLLFPPSFIAQRTIPSPPASPL
jgi:hypothetical protein